MHFIDEKAQCPIVRMRLRSEESGVVVYNDITENMSMKSTE